MSEPKVMVGIPNTGTVRSETMLNFMVMEKPCRIVPAFIQGSLVYVNRNKIAKYCLQQECDYLLFVDSDIVMPHYALKQLLEADADVITGVYYGKQPPFQPVLVESLEEQKYVEQVPEKIFNVEACGMGFCLIKAEVLKTIKEHWFTPIKGLGEDFSFCQRVLDAGYKIACDGRLQLGHIKTNYMVTFEDREAILEQKGE